MKNFFFIFLSLVSLSSFSQTENKKTVIEYPADKDHEFEKGSLIDAATLTESKINDLAVLGQVWGFIKYHHPKVAKGKYNMDEELFRIMPKVLAAKSKEERNLFLSVWIGHFGEVKGNKKSKKEDRIKIKPDYSWMQPKELGETVCSQLSVIQNAKRPVESYYIAFAEGVGNPVFKNEAPYPEMNYNDPGYRFVCLYRYWNIIQYFFPYKDLIGEDWNGVLKEFVRKYIDASSDLAYKKTTLELIGRVHDSHAGIWSADKALREFYGVNNVPVEITFVEDKAVVTAFDNGGLSEKEGLKRGDVIEKINDKTVSELVREKLPYAPASNYPTQLRVIADLLLRTNDSTLMLGCKRGESEFSLRVKCYKNASIDIRSKFLIADTCFKMILPDIGYLNPSNTTRAQLPGIFTALKDTKAKGLIIDFRCYPSDFIVFPLASYLLPERISFVKFSNTSTDSPGLFQTRDDLKIGNANNDYYKGKVIILVNENTQSSAEYHTMALRAVPGAKVIGSTTAGADGNVSQFFLPGGISTMISGIGVYYPDGKETQRVGIIPDIEMRPTVEGIRKGRDEVLEKALSIINGE